MRILTFLALALVTSNIFSFDLQSSSLSQHRLQIAQIVSKYLNNKIASLDDLSSIIQSSILPVSLDCILAYIDAILDQDLGTIGSVLYTGKYINNMGSFADCTKPDYTTKYYLYELQEDSQLVQQNIFSANRNSYMALCLPQNCTKEDVQGLKGVVKTFASIQNVTYSSINLSEVQAGGDLAISATKADQNIVWPILVVAGVIVCIIIASLLICACGDPDPIKEEWNLNQDQNENLMNQEQQEYIRQKNEDDDEEIFHMEGMNESQISNQTRQQQEQFNPSPRNSNQLFRQSTGKKSKKFKTSDVHSLTIEQELLQDEKLDKRKSQFSDKSQAKESESSASRRLEINLQPKPLHQSLIQDDKPLKKTTLPNQHADDLSFWGQLLSQLSLQGICKNLKSTLKWKNLQTLNPKKLRSWSVQHFAIIDGLRCLALMWAILGNVYGNAQIIPSDNIQSSFKQLCSNFIWVVLLNGATYAKDVFLQLSAFISVYQIISIHDLKKNQPSLLALYIDKLCRTVPFVAIVILVVTFTTAYLGDGPFWNQTVSKFTSSCQANWWQNLIFIRNLYSDARFTDCLSWLFYIQIEVQIFIIAPILAKIYLKSRKVGVILVVILFALSFVATAIIAKANQLGISMLFDASYYNLVFIKPYTNFDTYALGIFLAIMYHSHKTNYLGEKRTASLIFNSLKHSLIVRISFYITGMVLIALALSLPFSYYHEYANNNLTSTDYIWHEWERLMFITFSRSIFAFGLILTFIMPALADKGGIFRAACGCRGWGGCARYMFAVYVVAPWLILLFYASEEHLLHIENAVQLFLGAGMIVLSWVLGVFFGLCCQRPFTGVGKTISRKVM